MPLLTPWTPGRVSGVWGWHRLSCEPHRHSQNCVVGLKAVGALLPEVGIIRHASDVPTHTLASLGYEDFPANVSVLGDQSLGGAKT
jgi:hypothetical protein